MPSVAYKKFYKNLRLISKADRMLMNFWDKHAFGMVKRKSSIGKIKKACEITDQIFTKIISNFNFKTEIELRDFILSEIKNQGLKPSFLPIVTSGIRAGNEIHPTPTNNKLSGFAIIDLGVRYKGFCSDMTRTVFVGEPVVEDISIYNKVLESEILGIKLSKVGARCAVTDKKVREFLGEDSKYFIHTLGHGVGRLIHEPPLIFYKRDRHIFKEGMVITIEPGIYIVDKLGIRIEDTCLITKDGCTPLTRSPKELIVIR